MLHIATAFAMTPEEAAASLKTMLASTPHADMDGTEAIHLCAVKGRVTISPRGLLQLTGPGISLVQEIAKELTAPGAAEGQP